MEQGEGTEEEPWKLQYLTHYSKCLAISKHHRYTAVYFFYRICHFLASLLSFGKKKCCLSSVFIEINLSFSGFMVTFNLCFSHPPNNSLPEISSIDPSKCLQKVNTCLQSFYQFKSSTHPPM